MTEGFGIGRAVKELRNGKRVARDGWHGKGMYLELHIPTADIRDPFVVLFLPDGAAVPWTCSQSDLLAIDWTTI